MPKRGPKPFSSDSQRLMPVQMIAQKLGYSVRTVNYDLKRGMAKMRAASVLLLTDERGSLTITTREVR